MKPVPPEYPRNVPDIDFDELPYLSGTIVYAEDSDEDAIDAEELATRRAAKRRRIRANTHAYLRGEGLFISTAGLRGPFPDDWSNPWARRVKKRKQEVLEEETAVGRVQKILRQDNISISTPWKSRQNQLHFNPVDPGDPVDRAPQPSSKQPSPDEKVELWLRRNSALPHQKAPYEPASPSPSRSKRTEDATKREWTPSKQVITVSSQDVKAPAPQIFHHVAESFETIIPRGVMDAHAADTHSRLQGVLQSDPNTVAQQNYSSSEHTGRAEAEIIKIKKGHVITYGQSSSQQTAIRPAPSRATMSIEINCKPEETLSSALNPRASHLSDVDRVINHVRRKENEHIHIDNAQSSMNNGQPADAQIASKSYAEPVPVANSDGTSILMPPSAQLRPDLPHSVSNLSSAPMLLPTTTVSSEDPANLLTRNAQVEHSFEAKGRVNAATDINQNHNMDRVPDDNALERIASSQPQEQDQQADNVAELTTSTPSLTDALALLQSKAHERAIKSPPKPRERPNGKRKSAAFAIESSSLSSNTSIKNALKVNKISKSLPPPKYSPPHFSISHTDMDTSVESVMHSPRRSPRSSKKTSIQPGRSILRSVPATFSASPSKTIAEQNKLGMLVSGQNERPFGDDEDENFDLDGAINDLGSFLSTWDAEKSAVQI